MPPAESPHTQPPPVILPNSQFFAQVEAMLAEGREVQLRVRGNSMRPLLHNDRDRIVLRPCVGPHELEPGQVVLFRHGGRHILHRIVRREGTELVLAGDANGRAEERCAEREVVGVAVRVLRKSGRVVACDSLRWRLASHLWRSLPPWVRRQLLRGLGLLGR